ncbi:MAG: YlmC/YmxH family sporulation protein [Faecalibacterium sp.]
MTFSEICKKEVIQIESGVCLGKIDDLVLNPLTAEIEQFVMFGRPKLLGILGREASFYIQWNEIDKFGIDAILIHTPLPIEESSPKTNFFSNLKSRF